MAKQGFIHQDQLADQFSAYHHGWNMSHDLRDIIKQDLGANKRAKCLGLDWSHHDLDLRLVERDSKIGSFGKHVETLYGRKHEGILHGRDLLDLPIQPQGTPCT